MTLRLKRNQAIEQMLLAGVKRKAIMETFDVTASTIEGIRWRMRRRLGITNPTKPTRKEPYDPAAKYR